MKVIDHIASSINAIMAAPARVSAAPAPRGSPCARQPPPNHALEVRKWRVRAAARPAGRTARAYIFGTYVSNSKI